MPRKADAGLEGRIMDAAYRLWSKKGEQGLTMRAVARAAKTTTTSMYERFADKGKLLNGMRERARRELFEALRPSQSIEEACRRAFDFISEHGAQYRLLTTDWGVRLAKDGPTPSYDLLKALLAKRLGGEPEDHKQLALGLVALVHGTALLRPPASDHEKLAGDFRDACLNACDALVTAAAEKNGTPTPPRK
ncbi:MAG TPA: helix-turn-helix domain-containing protein [Candidatus Acidoferrum sp.]|jgi:AcrR family transcriptional regulator|nr:helix-turn-helix domain-containing protein [Candidatus Acidoferrum sp.]